MATVRPSPVAAHSPWTAPSPAEPVVVRRKPERRTTSTRDALKCRTLREFEIVPGRVLTLAEAARLLELPASICARTLAGLVADGKLYRVRDDHHNLAGPAEHEDGPAVPLTSAALARERRASSRMATPPCRECQTRDAVAGALRTENVVYFRCARCGGVWELPKPKARLDGAEAPQGSDP